jgi:hypothetical protein
MTGIIIGTPKQLVDSDEWLQILAIASALLMKVKTIPPDLPCRQEAIDTRPRFCSTLAMTARLQKASLALIFALSFILNGSAMRAAHANKPAPASAMMMANGAMPCDHIQDAQKHHPCCPHQGKDTASCTLDCCTSVVPVIAQTVTEFSFVQYKQRPKPVLALASRIADPPSRPPKV